MKKINKLLRIILIFTLIFPIFGNFVVVNAAHDVVVHEEKNEEYITEGIKHEHIQRFTTDGWLNINIVRADLSNPNVNIQTMFNPEGLIKKSKVSEMVTNSNAIVGINGDYFNYLPVPNSLGAQINNGEIISSPVDKEWALPAIYMDYSNNVNIGYFERTLILTHNMERTFSVAAINKISQKENELILLNKYWGPTSVGNTTKKNAIEVLVIDDIVREIRSGGEPFEIPTGNGFVLRQNGDTLLELNVGDNLYFNHNANPNISNLKFALGGGSIILQNGLPTATNIINKGNQPRTGVGISQNRQEIIFITIDGRGSSYVGVTQEKFGELFKEFGAENAMNLDGGGSTSMAIKPLNNNTAKIINNPSGGVEREVVNGLGIYSTSSFGTLTKIKIEAKDDKVFLNGTRTFNIKGFDEKNNLQEIDPSRVTIFVEDNSGTTENNKFTALKPGKTTLTIFVDGISETKELEVLDSPVELIVDREKISVANNTERSLGNVYGVAPNGKSALIEPNNIQYIVNGNIGTVSNGFINSTNDTNGIITMIFGNARKNISVSVGYDVQILNKLNTLNGMKYWSYPKNLPGKLELTKKEKENVVALNYDFTKGDTTRVAYLFFDGKGIQVPNKPSKIALKVKGDANGSLMRILIKDSQNNEFREDLLGSINFNNWQTVTVEVPEDVVYPIFIQSVYVAETTSAKKYNGTILFSELSSYSDHFINNVEVEPSTKYQDALNFKKEATSQDHKVIVTVEAPSISDEQKQQVKQKINNYNVFVSPKVVSETFSNGINTTQKITNQNNYSFNNVGDISYITLDVNKRGIRHSNSQQWPALKNIVSQIKTNNIIVLLNGELDGAKGFKDKLEKKLFNNMFKQISEEEKNVFIVQVGKTNKVQIRDGIRYITIFNGENGNGNVQNKLTGIEFILNESEINYNLIKFFQ